MFIQIITVSRPGREQVSHCSRLTVAAGPGAERARHFLGGMPDPATDASGRKTGTRNIVLPDVPPEGALLHAVLEYRKQLDLALASYGLVEVAAKQDAPECATVHDFDLAPLLAAFPAPGDRQYYPALQFRLQKEKENSENASKRTHFTMTKRTEIYTGLVASCEKNAKVLGDEMVECCNYASLGIVGSWFDGPRAYDMLMLHLLLLTIPPF